MAVRSEKKILRIGIIHGGKIVEERLVKNRRDVTVGSRTGNTFVIPASGMPRKLKLFEIKGGRYHLSFTNQMNGRVSVGNGSLDFSSIKSQKLARRRGEYFKYLLPEYARGKVSIGEVTLLFQFVTPPPEPQKLVLPKEAKGGLIKSIDIFFSMLLCFSAVIHVSSLTYLSTIPIPEGFSIDQVPDRFAKLIVPERKEISPGELEGPRPADEEKKKEPEEKKEQEDPGERSEEEIRKAAAAKEVQEAVRDSGILKIIGAKGEAGGGALMDLLDRGGRSQGLDDALARAQGVRAAKDGDDIRGPAGGEEGRRADIGDLATEGAGKVAREDRAAAQVRGSMQRGAIDADTTTVDADQIGRYIRTRQQAIQACYEQELRRNPQLSGRLVVSISISTNGRVSAIHFLEDTVGSAAVVNCIRTRIRTWAFPVRPPEETAVSVPFIFAPTG